MLLLVPTEIQTEIILRVHHKDRVSLRSTCKYLLNLLDNRFLQFSLGVEHVYSPDSLYESKFVPLLQNMSEVSRKKIRTVEYLSGSVQIMEEALPYLSSLAVLRFSAPDETEILDNLLKKINSSLTDLDLSSIRFSSGAMKFLPNSLTSLRIMNLQMNLSIEGLPISLISMQIGTDCADDVSLLPISTLQKLTYLRLDTCSSFIGKALQHFPVSLTQLEFWFCKDLKDLSGLKHLTRLKSLDITGTNIEDNSLIHLPFSLQNLILYGNLYLSDRFTSYLNVSLSSLELKGRFSMCEVMKHLSSSLQSLILRSTVLQSTLQFPSQLQSLHVLGASRGSLSGCIIPPKLRDLRVESVKLDLETVQNVPLTVTQLTILQVGITQGNITEIVKGWISSKRKISVVFSGDQKWTTTSWKCWNPLM